MFTPRLIRSVSSKFTKFPKFSTSALIVDDIYDQGYKDIQKLPAATLTIDDIYDQDYKVFPISQAPPICPICNEFVTSRKHDCKFEIIDGSCPLKLYYRNKELIDDLKEKTKKDK